MQLIGMLDSPYVRRVAISLRLLDVDFSHRSLSVFRHVEEFRAINPVVKAPSLVLDDGQVLMDSSLIIDLAEYQAGRSLMPAEPAERVRATRLLGLALAACEKAVQLYYELQRDEARRDAAWYARVDQQLRAACAGLELELLTQPLMQLTAPNALVLFYVVLFPSTLAYLCYNRGVHLIGANRSAPFLHLVPVFGAVMAIVLLGEKLQSFHIVGFALVIVGVVVAARKQ